MDARDALGVILGVVLIGFGVTVLARTVLFSDLLTRTAKLFGLPLAVARPGPTRIGGVVSILVGLMMVLAFLLT